MKKVFFAFAALLACTTGHAQDRIFKTTGTVVEAKIKSVGPESVIYSRYDNPTGPEYTILKTEVEKIKYENGSEQWFKGDDADHRSTSSSDRQWHSSDGTAVKLRRNVLAIAPIQFTENGVAGVSLSYERALDKESIIAFYVPAILTFSNNQNNYPGASQASDPMFYVMPGIKIYPTGGFGKVKYAIGPSLVIADGTKTGAVYDPYYGGLSYYTNQDHFMLGMMVNQSVNINATPRLYIGSEFGFGFTYINSLAGVNQTTAGLVQFSFKIGYRF